MPPNPSGDRAGIENRIEPTHPIGSGFGLGPADVGRREDRLALQVAGIDHIVIDQRQPPDSRSGEVLQRGRTNPPAADQHDMRLRQRHLPCPAHFGQHDVAGKTVEAVSGQGHAGALGAIAARCHVSARDKCPPFAQTCAKAHEGEGYV